VHDATCPRVNRGNGVGRGCTTLLPDTVVASNGSVSGFGLHDAILVHAHGGHETERAEALRDDVRLNVTVVVLAGPDETALAFEYLCDQVIDESVLVVNASSQIFVLIVLLVLFFEDIHEEAIVFLQYRVLRRQFERISTVKRIAQAGLCE